MKNILVPTDFSETAENALFYAAELAAISNANLIIFHVYNYPVDTADLSLIASVYDQFENLNLESLRELKAKVHEKLGTDLCVEFLCKMGSVAHEINELIETKDIDLVVIGTQGKGYLQERFMGSTASSLVKQATQPVLVIDAKIKFEPIQEIALAFDYKDEESLTAIDPVISFCNLFKAHISILQVLTQGEVIPSASEAIAGIKLANKLEGVGHSFHFIKNEDVVTGINEFIVIKSMDLIAMIPKKHSFLANLMHESNSKKMAFHSIVPFLALPA